MSLAAPAFAQQRLHNSLDTQLFTPTATTGTTFSIDSAGVPRHGTFVFGIDASYTGSTLEVVPPGEGAEPVTVVGPLVQAELLAAVGLFEMIELGMALPIMNAQAIDAQTATLPTVSDDRQESFTQPGDVRFSLKVPILRGDFALAGRGAFSLPLYHDGDGCGPIPTDPRPPMGMEPPSCNRFMSAGYWTAMGSAVAQYRAGNLTLGGEAGLRFKRPSKVLGVFLDDEVQLSAGARYDITPAIAAILEGHLRVGIGEGEAHPLQNPGDFNVGGRWSASRWLNVDLGVGSGFTEGYGTPDFRIFAIARYATEREACPQGPEDFDGYMDGDYCYDADNDADGVPDDDDDCPNDAEDLDGFLDTDGCPDVDNDADGTLDAADRCPTESEDRDGNADDDGCPEQDNDEDGIEDGADQCPMEPEDRDGFQDEDGCPEPGPEQFTVTVTDTRILISERIYFDFDTDVIRPVSKPLLDQVARVIRDLPGRRGIRVEGYTDNQGAPEYNLDLSYRRARSVVEYLVSQGVPRDRLDYVGYGQERPVAPNDSTEGQALNRRVEFTIMEPGEARQGSRRNRER